MSLRELKLHWPILLAVSLGISLGAALTQYTMSLFSPAMLEEFGWTKAEFALLGSLPLLTLPLVPLVGRFTDRFGARVAAMIGFIGVPLGFVGFAMMQGGLIEFFAIYAVQLIFGLLTTSVVFCRDVVERFDASRGIALSILMTGPPLAAALMAPILDWFIDAHGWRSGYLVLALLSGLGGLTTVLLMGRGRSTTAPKTRPEELRLIRQELWALIRHPSMLLVLCGMFLVNLPQVLATSQLKLLLLDNAVSSSTATWMVSLYAIGVIVGRFITGLALDRVATHLVAICALGLPAIGFIIFATPITAVWIISLAVATIGLAQGAEGDIGAYSISRQFDMRHYSLLLGFVMCTILGGGAAGSLILSYTLRSADSFTPFLLISACATAIGALLFFLTGRFPSNSGAPEQQRDSPEVDTSIGPSRSGEF